ncbi:MAG: hypothetical protein R3C59_29425 [Planctomycetaceae bacterium]
MRGVDRSNALAKLLGYLFNRQITSDRQFERLPGIGTEFDLSPFQPLADKVRDVGHQRRRSPIATDGLAIVLRRRSFTHSLILAAATPH